MIRGKRGWKDKFTDLPIDRKLLIVFLTPLILMLAVSLLAVQVSLDVYDRKYSQSTVKELEYFIEKVDSALTGIETFSYRLAMNYDTQRLLYEYLRISEYPKYQYEMRFVMLRFLQEVMSSDTVESFIYTDGREMRYSNGRKIVNIPDSLYGEMLEAAHAGSGRLVFSEPTKEFPFLVSARDIRYYINADLTYLGTLLFITDLSGIIDSYVPILGIGQNRLFIENEKTTVYSNAPELSSSIRTLTDPLPHGGYMIGTVGGRRFFICAVRSSLTGWRYIDMFPYGELFSSSLRTRLFLVAGFIALYILVSFAVQRFSRRITGPLKELSKSMAIVNEGKFDDALSLLGDHFPADEIGRLKKDYAIMLSTIHNLFRENYEKQLLIKDTKYLALKAQINPHFLYNTLNSISWMVQFQRNDEARRMITSLGKLLHRAAQPDIMAVVEDEAELLRDYLFIQKVRYEDRADFSLHVEPGLENVRMPQMLLQPLVENSIHHAIDASISPCRVSVDISRVGDRLSIAVKDDGPGMDEATLADVRTFRYRRDESGIGLKNIQGRLALIYGEDFTFSIQSEKDRGTEITIVIPIFKEAR